MALSLGLEPGLGSGFDPGSGSRVSPGLVSGFDPGAGSRMSPGLGSGLALGFGTGLGGGFLEIFFFLIVFAAILFLAYITTRIVAKKTGIRAKTKYMEVIDRLEFGSDKQLFIVRVGKGHYLISKSAKGLEMLAEVEVEEIEEPSGSVLGAVGGDFKSLLEKHLNFGAMKDNSKGRVFRRNVGKIRKMSEDREGPGQEDGEGEYTDKEN